MRKLIFTALTSWSLLGSAQVTVVVDNLKLTSMSKVSKITHFTHSLKCYPGGKGNETDDWGVIKIENVTKLYLNESGVSEQVQVEPRLVQGFRTIRMTLNKASSGQASDIEKERSYDLSLNDFVNPDLGVVIDSSDCHFADLKAKISDSRISGSLRMNIEVPANTWALDVQVSSATGVFRDLPPNAILNALNSQNTLKIDGDGHLLLWVKPESTVSLVYQIPENAYGRSEIGQLHFKLKHLGNSRKLMERLLDPNVSFESKSLNNQDALSRLDGILEIITHAKEIKELSKGKDPNTILNKANALFEFANSSAVINDTYGLPLRTAAALASFQLAADFLDDMRPYCQKVEIELPISQNKVTILGLRAAGFWLTRQADRLEVFNYDPYEYMVNELVRIQSQGITYKQLMNDEPTRLKFKKAHEILSKSGVMAHSPYGTARFDLARALKYFKTIGDNENDVNALLQELTALDTGDYNFVVHLNTNLNKFHGMSSELVDGTSLRLELDNLIQRSKAVSVKFRDSIKLAALVGGDKSVDVFAKIAGVLYRPVNILKSNINMPYFDNIRKVYYDANNIDTLAQQMNSCLKGQF